MPQLSESEEICLYVYKLYYRHFLCMQPAYTALSLTALLFNMFFSGSRAFSRVLWNAYLVI